MGSGVVQVVGKSRALGASLVAAGVVLAGCASGDGDDGPTTATTTSPAAAEPSGSPWDLPLEQRPALFDPCEEIPIEAVERAVGAPVAPDEFVHHHRPDELYSCGWKNDEVLLGVIGSWQSRQGFLGDPVFEQIDTESVISGRPGFRATDQTGRGEDTCYQIFFTSRGSVVINVNLLKALREFRGERSSKACDVLDQTIEPVMKLIPEGDF